MSISQRIHDTVEGWQVEWKDRLGGWLGDWLAFGVTKFAEDMEPGAIDAYRPYIQSLIDNPNTPPELKAYYEKTLAPGNPFSVVGAMITMILGSFGALLGGSVPVGNIMRYSQDKLLGTYRFDPQMITQIWLRNKAQYETFFEDLREQGWTEPRIDIAKELAKIIPPLADMVRFADFGALDPKIIELWRQFYDAPSWIQEPMSLLGITNEPGRDWANKYWFSHWRQPGRFELGEIYRRGLLGKPKIGQAEVGGDGTPGAAEELVKNAYLTQGFSSFWQDHLLQLVREIPTRVDVRRWWDMRTIDEAELRSIYQRHGYFGKDLENYVVWTKVYVAFPDLLARYKNDWIGIEDVRREVIALGMPEARVEELLQTKFKKGETAQIAEAKKVSQTAIIKWVKEDIEARWEEGIDLLMDLGYDENGARFVLDAYIAGMGSPETYEDWKKLTAEYKRVVGPEVKAMPEELKKAADEVLKLTKDVEALNQAIKDEEAKLIPDEILPEEATARLEELQVARNRALAELERVKIDYEAKLAAWRYKGT